MDYRQFQKQLAEEVQNRAPRELQVRFRTLTKNNGGRRLTMELRDKASGLVPSISTEQYFDAYQRGVPIAHLANLVLEQADQYACMPKIEEQFFASYEKVAPHLYCKLVNAERNRAQLCDLPHENWLDLAVVVYYQVDPGILRDASVLIKNEHLTAWGIDERTLLSSAWTNTTRKQKSVFQTLGEALGELCGDRENLPRETDPIYLLTNRDKCFGAVCICYPGMSGKIADLIGGDYFVIPSSIHECLILRAGAGIYAHELEAMIREINRTQLSPQEVLSDHVYRYDAKKRCLRMGIERRD